MTGPTAYVGAFEHPPAGLRREAFSVRVAVGAAGDPPTRWRVPKGSCPACRRGHDEIAVSWRRPRSGERPGGAVPLDEIAEPLPDPNAGYPHPVERRVSLD